MNAITTSLDQFYLIEKEEITKTSFPKDEVLNNAELVRERFTKIHEATSMGNIANQKVNILFIDDSQSKKRIYTTIWAHTPENVVLKKGNTLPVHRIVDIFD